jgi:hypothetical protein
MSKEATILKEVWVPAEKPFLFREAKDPRTGEQKFIMSGLILPFNKISRNNVLYNAEAIKEKHKQLVGRPVMYNHQLEGMELPRGHFIESYVIDQPDDSHPVQGWYYKADIDPHETDLIRKLRRGDLRHVSIQLVGGRVLERINQENGSPFSEAFVSDIIEGSIVPAPGFLDTTAQFAEAFKPQEQVTSDPASGAGPVIPDTSQEAASCAAQEQGGNSMARHKENEAGQDTQAPASAAGVASKGTPLDPQGVGQNDGSGMIAKENDANADSQAAASIMPDSTKGTPLDAKGAGQDTGSGLAGDKAASKMEKARKEAAEEEDEEELEESADEPKEELKERFREFREMYESDMGKMTDIVERLKEEIDTLKGKVEELNGSEPAKEADNASEPQPPMTESMRLKNIFTEAIKPKDEDSFKASVRKVIYG